MNTRADRLKPVEKRKTRNCLKCNKPFKSSWDGHRICSSCKSANSKLYIRRVATKEYSQE